MFLLGPLLVLIFTLSQSVRDGDWRLRRLELSPRLALKIPNTFQQSLGR
jgi:hypothetical protein